MAKTAPKPGPVILHPAVTRLPFRHAGPIVQNSKRQLLAADRDQFWISRDRGKTWRPQPIAFTTALKKQYQISNERAMLCTRRGTIILSFTNINERVWNWCKEISDALPGTRLPHYAMRSTDGGKTWDEPTMLHEAWTGDARDIIQLRSGRVIITSQRLLHDPGRHGVVTYRSDDEGATWKASNLIDLGGQGHHGGVYESTVEQLQDGRLLLLLRTNWGRFWQAFSDDEGASWREIGASHITASSSPGMLKRLASGRLALIYNQLYPEGRKTFRVTGGDGNLSEVPTVFYREQLSLAFSVDEGLSFTPPVVLARQKNAWLAYPRLLEPKPGVLWITTMQGDLQISAREEEIFRAAKSVGG